MQIRNIRNQWSLIFLFNENTIDPKYRGGLRVMSYNQEWYKKKTVVGQIRIFFRALSTLQLTKEFLEMQLEVYGNTS